MVPYQGALVLRAKIDVARSEQVRWYPRRLFETHLNGLQCFRKLPIESLSVGQELVGSIISLNGLRLPEGIEFVQPSQIEKQG